MSDALERALTAQRERHASFNRPAALKEEVLGRVNTLRNQLRAADEEIRDRDAATDRLRAQRHTTAGLLAEYEQLAESMLR